MSEPAGNGAADSGQRDPVERLLDEFLAARRQGSAPDIEAHVARAGARAAELRELIESAEMLEDLKGSQPRGLALHTPQVFGDYRIVAEIGRGGMGVVYEAEQITLGRRVAVKVLPPQALRSESRLVRFKREAQTAAKLHHTNIVPVFGVGEQDGMHYYVMQLIVGRPLDEVVRALRGEQAPARTSGSAPKPRSGSMALSASSAAQALRAGAYVPKPQSPSDVGPGDAAYYRSVATLGLQVADALTYAHAQGTLHRDIKPANLILDAHGVLWVTDFGLAKVIEDETFTHSGDLVGTLQYMAPEQFGGHADERTDVHGLGLVLYELTTLRPAFVADSRGELIDRVKRQEPVPSSRVRQGVPKDLDTIIGKATAKDPKDRYASADDLRDDLERFLQDRPIRARPVSAIESGWRWCRRNRVLASVGAVAVLGLTSTAVVGVAGYLSTRRALGAAVDATRLAEANVALALAGFESVFARVVGPDMLRPDDDEEGDVVAPGVSAGLSANDEDLLVELLRVYDQLAASNRGNAAARQLTARAYHRVGEIHLQLGKPTDAVASYERSVALYGDLLRDGAVALGTLMQVENGLCRALWVQGESERSAARGARDLDDAARAAVSARARACHDAAATLAESVLSRAEEAAAQSPLMRFECARAHELLAQLAFALGHGRRGSDRGRRDEREPSEGQEASVTPIDHYRSSLALHESLWQEEPNNPAYRHATARACLLVARHLTWARPPRDSARREEDAAARGEEIGRLQRRALDLLEPLTQQVPPRPQYRQALIMALRLQPPDFPFRGWRRFERGPDPTPADPEQVARHLKAVALAESLVVDFPGAEEFVREFCEVAIKTAGLLQATDVAAAQALYRRAVGAAETMAKAHPDNGNHALFLAHARVLLAQALWRGGGSEREREEALASYRRAKSLCDAQADAGTEAALARGLAITLRVVGADYLLRSDDAPQARTEAHEAELALGRLVAARSQDAPPSGRSAFSLSSFGRALATIYDKLGQHGAGTDDDRARAEALHALYPARESSRRNQ